MGPNLRIGVPPLGVPHGVSPPTPTPSLPQPPAIHATVAKTFSPAAHPPSQGQPIVMTGNPMPQQPLPQPPTPTVLIDQNTPPTVPTSPVAPPSTGSPYPTVPSPYYPEAPGVAPAPMFLSFWQRWKAPILIGGGVLGGVGLIALIVAASNKRRVPAL